jgi:hypothetical protein
MESEEGPREVSLRNEEDGEGMHGEERTSYHLGPSAQILINFSLNSRVCLSIVLRSNFGAAIVRSDCSGMVSEVVVLSFWFSSCSSYFFIAYSIPEKYVWENGNLGS